MQEIYDEGRLLRCVYALFDTLWVSKAKQSELYREIESLSIPLKSFFEQWFRYRLIIEADYAKLMKIPTSSKPWMGIKTFSHRLDYVFLACFIAYLEEKGEGQQFVLQDVCEAVLNYYPGPAHEVEWTSRSVRQSLVRAIRYCEAVELVVTFDRRIEDFQDNAAHDMLFETTSFLRHAMNTFFFDFSSVTSLSDLESCMKEESEREQVNSRQHLMRRLMIEPVIHKDQLSTEEKSFLTSYGKQLRENVTEKFDEVELEEYSSVIILTHSYQHYGDYYPTPNKSSTLSLITTQIGTFLWNSIRQGDISARTDGTVVMAKNKGAEFFEFIKKTHGYGWSVQFIRESSENAWEKVLRYMESFGFARRDDEFIYFMEALGRVTGEYEGGEANGEMEAKSTWTI